MTTFAGNAEFLAAFGTTGSQHSTAVCSGHTLTESVLISSFPVRRLESPFHDRIVLSLNLPEYRFHLRAAKITDSFLKSK